MKMQRAKLQVMRLTNKAADRIKDIIATSQKQAVGLRVGVKNGGCAGMEYTIEYAESADPLDEIVEEHGVRLFIEPKAVLFLLGTEMDYEIDKLSSGFVFKNPNQTSACGCGESVEIQPVSRAQLEAYAKDESALGGS
jgi:iron-sulfur cluster assembly protein